MLTDKKIQDLEHKYMSKSDEDIDYVFRAPKKNPWFSCRESQMKELEILLLGNQEEAKIETNVSLAAICGLGGCGKTSLVAEYAQRMKSHYQGGVFWISGEDDTKLESSVNDIALNIGIRLHDSFDKTLSETFARISRIDKPWLIVVDDMDEFVLSQNVKKIISGSWQHDVAGHIVITTRRKPSALAKDVRGFQVFYSNALTEKKPNISYSPERVFIVMKKPT